MKKPRCFVAMAFGRDDTNALYERKIKPVLRTNGITPVIIDRRESLEDINKQIMEQLVSLTPTRFTPCSKTDGAQRTA
jgi:hypothetical protein